jgi:hypothetical protein
METAPAPVGELNSSQKLYLLIRCEYADKLLSEMEAILPGSTSKSPFPKYKQDLSPWNPVNTKRMIRLVVALPSPRLQQGIVVVDTPGLGSLAITNAAETMAYLPHCDLGVVLIDAGSILTPEDLATIQSLSDAGIPVLVLLSKADLLGPEDWERTL